jgi:hypothetical protein
MNLPEKQRRRVPDDAGCTIAVPLYDWNKTELSFEFHLCRLKEYKKGLSLNINDVQGQVL